MNDAANEYSSSGSEEESGMDEYEKDFVVPDDQVDEPSPTQDASIPKKRPKPKRRRLRKHDDEDQELIAENLKLPSGARYPMANDIQRALAEEEEDLLPPPQSESDSEGSVEPGEIPEGYNENRLSLAATIFGYDSIPVPEDNNSLVFDPSEYKEHYMTTEDERVKEIDEPERLQSWFANREEFTEAELDRETEWLLQRFLGYKPNLEASATAEKIKKFLRAYHQDKYEVAYIAKYLIYNLQPEIDSDRDLLQLGNWDKEWGHVLASKRILGAKLVEAAKNSSDLSQGAVLENQPVLAVPELPEFVKRLLSSTSTENYLSEINDLEAFIKVYVSPFTSPGLGRRRAKYHPLEESRRNNIARFASNSCLSPQQLCENLTAKAVVHLPPVVPDRPQQTAFELQSESFNSEALVLKAGIHLKMSELAAFPPFREWVRAEYSSQALLYTSATKKGQSVLDVFHPYYRVKSLTQGKAYTTWKPKLWAEVLYCEKNELINVEIALPWRDLEDDRIFAIVKKYYLSEGLAEHEGEWNTVREEILQAALRRVYEDTKNDIRLDLTARTEEWITAKVQAKFFEILNKAPCKQDDNSSSVLCSVVTTPEQLFGQTAVVVLSSSGDVLHHQVFNSLTVRNPDTLHEAEKTRFSSEKADIIRLLMDYRPGAIVIGANSLQSVNLRRFFGGVAESLSLEHFNPAEFELDIDDSKCFTEPLRVYMEDTAVAHLFTLSNRASALFPEYKTVVKTAISLGRFVQNPTAETLGLWTDPNQLQILHLKLHPLQGLVSEAKILHSLEMVAVDVCSSQGVDINEAAEKPHLATSLPFLPGLGHVKAHALIRAIKTKVNGKLKMRVQLIAKKLLSPKVYENAVGFLRVPYDEGVSDPLDSTRIHPVQYELAKLIAKSAIGEDFPGEKEDMLTHRIMRNPQDMEDLALDLYADRLKERGQQNMRPVLEFIVKELTYPFAVQRRNYAEPAPEDLLYLCTKETKHTLRYGVLAHVIVIAYDDRRNVLRCRLECGLEGSVDRGSLFDRRHSAPECVSDKFQRGQTVTARVIEVSAKLENPKDLFFRVRLSLLTEDITAHSKFITLKLDDSFVLDENDWVEAMLMEDQGKTGQKYVPRVVNHPRFKNIGYNTGINELSSEDIGAFLFRPSSKGQDHITCTWKFFDNIYSHLDIIEEGKPANSMLGTRFRVSHDLFDSLQEIVDRYLIPCEKLTKESIAHPKFVSPTVGSAEYVITLIQKEKQAMPSTIPYKISVSPKHPQYFLLQYMPGERVICEFIKVKPRGLFFHEAYHNNMNYLVYWFKRHYGDRVYKGQLARAKEPTIDTNNYFAVPPKLPTPAEDFQDPARFLDRPYDSYLPESTPYLKTPRIGGDEWAGGKQLTNTPHADDWNSRRNYDSWEHAENIETDEFRQPRERERRRGRPREGGQKRSLICYNCQESGHFAKECSQPRKNRRTEEESEGTQPGWNETHAPTASWGETNPTTTAWGETNPTTTAWGETNPTTTAWGEPNPTTTAWGETNPTTTAWGETNPTTTACGETNPEPPAWGSQPGPSSWDNPQTGSGW